MRVRSMVGLIPLFACLTLEDEVIQKLPDFKKRLTQFLQERPSLAKKVQETAVQHNSGMNTYNVAGSIGVSINLGLKFII